MKQVGSIISQKTITIKNVGRCDAAFPGFGMPSVKIRIIRTSGFFLRRMMDDRPESYLALKPNLTVGTKITVQDERPRLQWSILYSEDMFSAKAASFVQFGRFRAILEVNAVADDFSQIRMPVDIEGKKMLMLFSNDAVCAITSIGASIMKIETGGAEIANPKVVAGNTGCISYSLSFKLKQGDSVLPGEHSVRLNPNLLDF